MQKPWRAADRASKVVRPAAGNERRLIHGASHALLNSLTACRWELELLSDDPEARRATVANVTDELERMERLLDDLSVLIDASEPGFLSPEAIDLELFVHELVAKGSDLGDRNWTIDDAGGTLFGDWRQITKAVMKLARNAVDNSDRDDTVAIGARVTDHEACIWVRDTGTGIPPAEQGEIMDAFARGADARRRYRGIGLGLAVAKAIAEAHGGRLEIQSRVGDGSMFTIVVPARR
jgi:two-component system OmpR family sensor kinase